MHKKYSWSVLHFGCIESSYVRSSLFWSLLFLFRFMGAWYHFLSHWVNVSEKMIRTMIMVMADTDEIMDTMTMEVDMTRMGISLLIMDMLEVDIIRF